MGRSGTGVAERCRKSCIAPRVGGEKTTGSGSKLTGAVDARRGSRAAWRVRVIWPRVDRRVGSAERAALRSVGRRRSGTWLQRLLRAYPRGR